MNKNIFYLISKYILNYFIGISKELIQFCKNNKKGFLILFVIILGIALLFTFPKFMFSIIAVCIITAVMLFVILIMWASAQEDGLLDPPFTYPYITYTFLILYLVTWIGLWLFCCYGAVSGIWNSN